MVVTPEVPPVPVLVVVVTPEVPPVPVLVVEVVDSLDVVEEDEVSVEEDEVSVEEDEVSVEEDEVSVEDEDDVEPQMIPDRVKKSPAEPFWITAVADSSVSLLAVVNPVPSSGVCVPL